MQLCMVGCSRSRSRNNNNAFNSNSNKDNNGGGNSKDGCEKSLQLRVSVRTHLGKVEKF